MFITASATGEACASAFAMAARESQKAWHTTSLLSKVRRSKCDAAIESFEKADARQIAEMLSDIAGPAFSGQAVQTGLDADKAAKLGRHLIQMFALSTHPGTGVAHAIACVDLMDAQIRKWIEFGSVDEAADGPNLKKISELVGGKPQIRLALLSPFAPALSVTRVVLRANEAGFGLKPAKPDQAPKNEKAST